MCIRDRKKLIALRNQTLPIYCVFRSSIYIVFSPNREVSISVRFFWKHTTYSGRFLSAETEAICGSETDSEEDFGGLFSDIDLASPKLGKTADGSCFHLHKILDSVLEALRSLILLCR